MESFPVWKFRKQTEVWVPNFPVWKFQKEGKVVPHHPTPGEGGSSTTKLPGTTKKNPDSKYTISDRLWIGHQERKKRNIKRGVGFGYAIFDETCDYVNTMSARYNKDGSEILIAQVGKNPRKITPLEAARLQGFPDKIVRLARGSDISDAQLYKQFGNAVPVDVIRAIAQNINKILINK